MTSLIVVAILSIGTALGVLVFRYLYSVLSKSSLR